MVNKSKCDRVETKPHVSRSDTVPSLEPALASVYCSALYSPALCSVCCALYQSVRYIVCVWCILALVCV